MKLVQLFVFLVTIFYVSQANLLIDKVKTNIFDTSPRDFETNVNKAMSKTKDLFSNDAVLLGVGVGLVVATQYAPFIKKFVEIAPFLEDAIQDKSAWASSLAKSIGNETSILLGESDIRWIMSTIKAMQKKIQLLDSSNPSKDNRENAATSIDGHLQILINFFHSNTSPFRKYPLLGGPSLLQLASLVSIFSPLANAIIPFEAKKMKIACQMLDTLLSYRPLMVYARLHKLTVGQKKLYSTILDVMKLPFDPKGYSRSNTGLVDCDRDCSLNRPQTRGDEVGCLKDDYSTDDYYLSKFTSAHCKEDYARLLRHRVEELFPIDVLNKTCDRKPRQPNGYGYFTIALQNVFTYGKDNGKACKVLSVFGCNSYVHVLVDGHEAIKTPTEKGKTTYDVNELITTDKIKKSSKITIEVWRPKAKGDDKLILRTEGDVDSYLKEPLRKGHHFEKGDNQIETISFWEDAYDETIE